MGTLGGTGWNRPSTLYSCRRKEGPGRQGRTFVCMPFYTFPLPFALFEFPCPCFQGGLCLPGEVGTAAVAKTGISLSYIYMLFTLSPPYTSLSLYNPFCHAPYPLPAPPLLPYPVTGDGGRQDGKVSLLSHLPIHVGTGPHPSHI